MVPTKLKIKGNKSFSLLGSLDTEEDLSKTWRLMTKVKEALEYGMRLENLSWRLWFMHHLMVHDQKTKTKFRRLSTVTTKKLETEKATNLKDLAVPIYRGTNNNGKAGGNASYGINNNIQNIMNGKKNSNNKKKSNKKNKQQQQKINNNNNDNVKSDSLTTNNSNGINSTNNNNNNNNNNNTITTSTIYDNNNTSTEIVTPTEPEFPFQATTNYVNNSNSKIEVDYSNNLIDPHDPNVDSPPMDTEILMDGMDGMDELSIPNGDMELIEHELIYYTLHQFTNDQSRFQVIQLPNDYSAPFRTSALIDPDNGPTMEIDITSMIENSGNLTDDSNLQYHTHHDSHNLSSHHHHHPHHHHHQQLTSINDQIVTTASSSSTNSRIHDAVYVGNNGTQASNLPPPLDTNIISSALSGSNGNNGGNNNNNPLNTPLNTPVSCLPTSGVLGNGNLIYANQFSADQNSSPTATTNTTATNNNNVYNNNNNATTSIPISPPISSSSTLKNNYSSSKKSISSSSSSSSPPQQEQRSTSTTPTETLSLPFSNNNNSNSDNNNTSSNINNSSRNSNSSNSNCNIKSDSNNNVNNNGTRNSSQSLQVSENRVKKSSSGNGEQQCHNCGVTSTPLWRRSTNDELLCNACGLYLKLHKMSRPKTMKPHIVRKDARDDEASQPRCSNCGTMTTPLWRRDEEGQTLCNACGLYFKLHHERRPLSMKTDVIKKRQRYENGQTPNRRVGKKLKANESQQQNLQDDVDHSNNQQGDLNNQSQVNKDSKPLMTFSKPSSKNTNSSLNISSNLNSINLTTSTITTTTTTSSSSSSNNSNNVNNNNIVQSLSI